MRMCCFEAICFFRCCCCCRFNHFWGENLIYTHILYMHVYRHEKRRQRAVLSRYHTCTERQNEQQRSDREDHTCIKYHDISEHIHVPATNGCVRMASRLDIAALSLRSLPLTSLVGPSVCVCAFHEIETDFALFYSTHRAVLAIESYPHIQNGATIHQMTYESFEMNLLFVTQQMA